jgi:uncharacterized protein DUF3806
MAEQTIEAPTDADNDDIARAVIHAQQVVEQSLGCELDGTKNDLLALQRVLDGGFIEREATYTLQALGLVFGMLFVDEHADFDWWMVEDEYGRDPAIRYKRTQVLIFPRTMISKRIEDGESVNVSELFELLGSRVMQLIEEGYH